MNRFALPLAAVAAFAIAPAVMAADHVDTSAASEAAPVKLVSWDGDFELLKSSRQMRVWRTHLDYKLTVDREGKVTGCEFAESFRLKRVSMRLCEVLSEHHTFEPARDAGGQPIEGSYSARLSYEEMRDRN